MGDTSGDPDDQLYPLFPPNGPEAEDDVVPLPSPLASPGDGELDELCEINPEKTIQLASFRGPSQVSKMVTVAGLAVTWKENPEGEENLEVDKPTGENGLVEEEDLMDTAVLKNVSFEVTQVWTYHFWCHSLIDIHVFL